MPSNAKKQKQNKNKKKEKEENKEGKKKKKKNILPMTYNRIRAIRTSDGMMDKKYPFIQPYFVSKVADDIMDESLTRRGQPCWYKKVNLNSFCNTKVIWFPLSGMCLTAVQIYSRTPIFLAFEGNENWFEKLGSLGNRGKITCTVFV